MSVKINDYSSAGLLPGYCDSCTTDSSKVTIDIFIAIFLPAILALKLDQKNKHTLNDMLRCGIKCQVHP